MRILPVEPARIGAVEAEPSAADHLLDVGLAEAGVGAARARGSAVDAFVDAAQKQVAIEGDAARVRVEHFVNGHVSLLSADAGSVRFPWLLVTLGVGGRSLGLLPDDVGRCLVVTAPRTRKTVKV